LTISYCCRALSQREASQQIVHRPPTRQSQPARVNTISQSISLLELQ